jgi:hypothetical protein
MTPNERAKLLETTDLFATAHAKAASGGQSNMPENLETMDHFVAFVQAPNPSQPGHFRLIELDGRRPAALDLGESTNLLNVGRCHQVTFHRTQHSDLKLHSAGHSKGRQGKVHGFGKCCVLCNDYAWTSMGLKARSTGECSFFL